MQHQKDSLQNSAKREGKDFLVLSRLSKQETEEKMCIPYIPYFLAQERESQLNEYTYHWTLDPEQVTVPQFSVMNVNLCVPGLLKNEEQE